MFNSTQNTWGQLAPFTAVTNGIENQKENGEFQKVGATDILKVDVRVIVATNEKLSELVKKEKRVCFYILIR